MDSELLPRDVADDIVSRVLYRAKHTEDSCLLGKNQAWTLPFALVVWLLRVVAVAS